MRSNKFILLTVFSLIFSTSVFATAKQRSFAIVVDKVTLEKCKSSIESYAQSVKNEGINPVIVVDKWSTPDSIKSVLIKMYKSSSLEGAVFIGDIPVPMIRNAQHLSTAFKMDQKRAWDQSSIPSDRFYDDFDLKFEYIKQDEKNKQLFYYNLSPEGAHNIRCEIYSARIKPPFYPGKDKYELINSYLNKVVKEKASARSIKNLTYFAGHGYNSDDMVARIDEKVTLLDQFKTFREGKGTINFIDYTYEDNVKYRLMAEIAREDVDLAILHHHGAEDTQYLNGSPITTNPSMWLELTKKFFRGKIRGSRDTAASKEYYIKNYNVPADWVSNAFDKKLMLKDSLDDAAINVNIPDMYGYKPNARFIVFDACFNGAFQNEDYISGHYIFNEGKTVVVKANSVNTLQDTWTNQLIGLLDLGVSVGNWAKGTMTLESHLIGDPTYKYAPSVKDYTSLDSYVGVGRSNISYWKKGLKSDINEVKSLSIKMLYEAGQMTPAELLSIQKSDKSPLVRLQAFNQIRKHYNPQLVEAIRTGLYDNYELLRRLASIEASSNMSPELMDDIFELRFAPGTSLRVEFQLKTACENYPEDEALAAFKKHVAGKEGKWYENSEQDLKALKYSLDRTKKEFEELLDPEAPAKSKKFTITALRNSTSVAYLDTLFRFMNESKDNELRATLAEAFGWYTNSYKRDEIIDFLKGALQKERDENVKFEINRTIQRLYNIPN